MSIEAMKQAIEALQKNHALINGTERFLGLDQIKDTYYAGCFDIDGINKQTNDAITALRAAIEQAEKQEPVAYRWKGELFTPSEIEMLDVDDAVPLYEHPRQWVGLTNDEIDEVRNEMLKQKSAEVEFLVRFVEQKLKEKNHESSQVVCRDR